MWAQGLGWDEMSMPTAGVTHRFRRTGPRGTGGRADKVAKADARPPRGSPIFVTAGSWLVPSMVKTIRSIVCTPPNGVEGNDEKVVGGVSLTCTYANTNVQVAVRHPSHRDHDGKH